MSSWVEDKVDECIRRGVSCACLSCRGNYLRAFREVIEETSRRCRNLYLRKEGMPRVSSEDCAQAIEAMLEPEVKLQKCTCDCMCDSCYDSDTLRAQFAAVEEKNRELEEQHAHDCDQFNRLAQEKADAEKERAAANERVKALEENFKQALSDLAFVDRALVAEVKSHAAARDLAEKLEAALEPTGFEDAWAEKQAEGYQYGPDALENVRFGWRLAFAAIRDRAGLTKEGT